MIFCEGRGGRRLGGGGLADLVLACLLVEMNCRVAEAVSWTRNLSLCRGLWWAAHFLGGIISTGDARTAARIREGADPAASRFIRHGR